MMVGAQQWRHVGHDGGGTWGVTVVVHRTRQPGNDGHNGASQTCPNVPGIEGLDVSYWHIDVLWWA